MQNKVARQLIENDVPLVTKSEVLKMAWMLRWKWEVES